MAGFRKAKQTQAALKLGIYGAAGDGKTFTASLIGEGIAKAYGKEVAFVDTEYGTAFYAQHVPARPVHPEAFDFDYLHSKSITEVLGEIKKLDASKYGVVILDSLTHLWEACKAAYAGKTTRIGGIPMQAWGQIKKPWKDLMALLLSSPMHVILCGRQGSEYETDEETGELKNVGYKMKAEGETQYEPHILLRMETVRDKKGRSTPTAFVEKDRTGVLSGAAIHWPNFDNIAKPLLPLLGGQQARIQTDEEVGARDAEVLAQMDREKTTRSDDLLKKFRARLELCESESDVDRLGKDITPEIKAQMATTDVAALREAFLDAKQRRKDGPIPVNPEE